jgi:branched-subunit amino acid transport protein
MAIGTENPKILQAIIIAVPIDMVELQRKITAFSNFCPATFFTALFFQTLFEESTLQFKALVCTSIYKNFF